MKRKGFTLVELLVVISIIALLMAILMPVLSKVKAIANQMVCGTNLSGIGKGMMLYSNDNDDQYPIAGGRGAQWSSSTTIANPWSVDPTLSYPYGTLGSGQATLSSCFYLLIKYTDMGTRQFVCKGDTGTTEFKLSDHPGLTTTPFELTDAWDFGDTSGGTLDRPANHCSYSYHQPFMTPGQQNQAAYPISPSDNPGCPLAADRNPYGDKNAIGVYVPPGAPVAPEVKPQWVTSPAPGHYYDQYKTGNAAAHQRNGQNVLFNDIHVSFERYPNVGVNQDNIYLWWVNATPTGPKDYQYNGLPGKNVGSDAPLSLNDSLLVNEYNK